MWLPLAAINVTDLGPLRHFPTAAAMLNSTGSRNTHEKQSRIKSYDQLPNMVEISLTLTEIMRRLDIQGGGFSHGYGKLKEIK